MIASLATSPTACSSRSATLRVPPTLRERCPAHGPSSLLLGRTCWPSRCAPRGRQPEWRATHGSTTTRRCAQRCGRWRIACGPTASRRCPSPTTTASSTVRWRTRRASGGTARTRTCSCPAPAVGSCSDVVTTAVARRRTRARRLRQLPALPGCLPHRSHRATRGRRCRSLLGVGVAEAGHHRSPPARGRG
jgi:hypothetical protein